MAAPGVGAHSGDPVWQLNGGGLQFSAGWITNQWNTDGLIDGAEVIGGLRFAPVSVMSFDTRWNCAARRIWPTSSGYEYI